MRDTRTHLRVGTYLVISMLLIVACSAHPAPAPAAIDTMTPTDAVAPTAEPTSGPQPGEKGNFALVMNGPIDDNSWHQVGYEAAMALKEQGVDVTYLERVPFADTERVMRELIEEGYTMIVGHSFNHQDAVFALAEEFPEVNFAWAGGIGRTAKNVADFDQPFYQAAYLVGIIAGHVSESGQLGALYSFDIPVCHAMGEALLAGAQTVQPDAELNRAVAGDWYDISKAKEAALAQADAGVDFWVACGQGPTFGTIEAARERGGYATGYVGDMTPVGSEVVLTSIVWNLEPMFKDMVQSTLDGAFDAPYYEYGIKEGALDIVINPSLASVIPDEALEKVEEVKEAIVKGDFVVPFVPE